MTIAGNRWLKRVSHGVPVARLLLAGEVALIARDHLSRLDRVQRRRLLTLLARAATRRPLSLGERGELAVLVARLEPRLLFGTAVRRISPVPIPKRLLYGRRGGPARRALARRS